MLYPPELRALRINGLRTKRQIQTLSLTRFRAAVVRRVHSATSISEGRFPRTVVRYNIAFKAFGGALDSKQAIVTRIAVLKQRGFSHISINGHLRCISAYLNRVHSEQDGPLLKVPRPCEAPAPHWSVPLTSAGSTRPWSAIRMSLQGLQPSEPEDFGVGDTVESGSNGALKIYGRFAAQHAGADGTAKIVIGLEPRLHLFRASGMELFARVSEALAQVLRQGHRSPSRSFEALLLAHPISINCRLVFEVERDCTKDLGESQSFEFSQDRLRRESFIEALDDGIQRDASTGHIVPTLALFDVFFRHRSQL
jgi:hypothetical protein